MATRDPAIRLILASASPRRHALLRSAGFVVEVDPSGVEEPEPARFVVPRVYAAELAWRKAHAVASRHASALILAADTVCAVEGQILNKPTDRDDAERMIRAQEERTVEVITGLILYRSGREEWIGAVERSIVRMRRLTDAERLAYLDSEQWVGKAGAYGVQDNDPIVTVVSGSWSNVVGLPMERLEQLLDGPARGWTSHV